LTDSNIPKVFIFGPGHLPYLMMFLDYGYKATNEFWEADLICLTGGADVHPSLYGEKPIVGTCSDVARDKKDALIYHEALEQNIPIVGVCRGGQFLNVMNGGKMWQDVNGHTGSHEMLITDTGQVIKVTSTHHQMMIPAPEAEILATAQKSSKRQSETKTVHNPQDPDIEVVFYPKTDSLCFQPHPEFADEACQNYFFDLLYEKFGEERGWFLDEVAEEEGADDLNDDIPFDDAPSDKGELEEFKRRFAELEEEEKKKEEGLGRMMDPETGEWVQLDSNGNVIEGNC